MPMNWLPGRWSWTIVCNVEYAIEHAEGKQLANFFGCGVEPQSRAGLGLFVKPDHAAHEGTVEIIALGDVDDHVGLGFHIQQKGTWKFWLSLFLLPKESLT